MFHGARCVIGCWRSGSIRRPLQIVRAHRFDFRSQQQPPHRSTRFIHNHHHGGNHNDVNINYTRVLVRPMIFTAAVGLTSFGAVAIYDYEETARRNKNWTTFSWSRSNEPQKTFSLEKYKTKVLNGLRDILPRSVWQELEEALQDPRTAIVGPIIATNVFLHALFWLPGFNIIKWTCFVHQTTSGQLFPMLLSTFAHGGIFHLGLNCYVLWNFGEALVHDYYTPQQFWAAYASAGTFASLGAILADLALLCSGRLVSLAGGLGASGAIYAVVFAAGLTHADEMSIGLFGVFYLPAKLALTGLAAFDFTALVLRWPTGLGHGAHLAGALAGYGAVNGGLHSVENYQREVVKIYKDLKKQWRES